MRTPKYLSPTSVRLWMNDPQEFYLNYLADNRPPRFPQTEPMSVGSAFDAFVKCYLHDALFGHDANGLFDCDTIFETQVEPQNRDFARPAGEHVFEEYKRSGALADLMIELNRASDDPRFEFTVEKGVVHETCTSGVTLLGKPDVFFKIDGCPVVYDWKVNGYCSKWNVSPKPQYIRLRPGNKIHKDAQPMVINGLEINVASYLETIDPDWAMQLVIYGWVLGEPVGTNGIFGIDQIVAKGAGPSAILRVATHRARISREFQETLFARIKEIWDTIHSGWIFRDMSEEESRERQAQLDNYHKAFEGTGNKNDDWYAKMIRKHDR